MNNEVDTIDNFFRDLDAFIKGMQEVDDFEDIKTETRKFGEKYGIIIEKDTQEDFLQMTSKIIANVLTKYKKNENIIDLLDKIPEDIKDAVEDDVIKNLKDEDKVAILSTIQNERAKADIIKTIENDELKLKAIRTLKTPKLIAEMMKTIEEDELKLNNLSIFQQLDYDKDNLFEISENLKAEVMKTIKDTNLKIQALTEQLSDELEKAEVIATIEDDSLKIKTLKETLKGERAKAIAIKAIEDDSLKIKTLKEELTDDVHKIDVIGKLENVSLKIKTLREEITDRIDLKRRTLKGIPEDEIMEALKSGKVEDEFTKIDMIKLLAKDDPDKAYELLNQHQGKSIEVLKRLYQKNNSVVQTIDSRILDEKYLKAFGEDKINLLSCFPGVQDDILKLPEKKFTVFSKCLDSFIARAETDEWTPMAEVLLDNIGSEQYDTLIENIEDLDSVDIDKLSRILQIPNDFNLETVKDIENFEKIKNGKMKETISKNGAIEEKKNAVLLKLFGQDIEYTKDLIIKYGEDIESLEDGDEKDFILVLKEIMSLEDENTLREIFNECDGIGLIDKTTQERNLKTAYGKLFNEGLYETKFEDIIDEKDLPEELRGLNLNVYDAGTDFKMIITSIAAYVYNQPENFKEDWNRPALGSQHFCASYIRNDMLGLPPIKHLCYGFNNMKEDALMLSGNMDISSTSGGFVSRSMYDKNVRYYTPDTQINNTERYNEMDFRRIQGGTKKQPDYIVVFKRDGKIDNIDAILQGAKDWEGKLPIVIVDVDRCLESERRKIFGFGQEKRRNTKFSRKTNT